MVWYWVTVGSRDLEQKDFVTQSEETMPAVSWRYWLNPRKFRIFGVSQPKFDGCRNRKCDVLNQFSRSVPLYYWSSNLLFSLTVHICVHNTEHILANVCKLPPLCCESSTSKYGPFLSRSNLYIKCGITNSLFWKFMPAIFTLRGLGWRSG